MPAERIAMLRYPFSQFHCAERRRVDTQSILHQPADLLACDDDVPHEQSQEPATPVTKGWWKRHDEPFQTEKPFDGFHECPIGEGFRTDGVDDLACVAVRLFHGGSRKVIDINRLKLVLAVAENSNNGQMSQ